MTYRQLLALALDACNTAGTRKLAFKLATVYSEEIQMPTVAEQRLDAQDEITALEEDIVDLEQELESLRDQQQETESLDEIWGALDKLLDSGIRDGYLKHVAASCSPLYGGNSHHCLACMIKERVNDS